MRRFHCALLAAVAVIGFASVASAAPPSPIYSWTGFYAGGNIGYSWGRANIDFNDPGLATSPPSTATSYSTSLKLNGLIGGAQIGYNWQYDKQWVFGIETDFQGSAEKDSTSFINNYCPDNCSVLTQTRDAKILWFGTVRSRVGALFNPTTLLYGTGGLAYGKVSASGALAANGLASNASFSFGDSKTNVGWTLGAGIEGAIPNSRDWTWKAEYLYINLRSLSGAGTEPITGSTYNWNAKFTDNIVRVGVNYRFH